MPEAAQPATPSVRIVNDLFWLKWAADSVDKADDTRRTSAEKLTAAVGWFWTVYTAVAVAGVAFADRQFSLPVAVLIFVPVVSLVLAYLLAVWVMLPVDLSYDPRSPSEIQAAYVTVMRERRTRAAWALGATIASGCLVVLAGAAVAVTRPADNPSFHTAYSAAGGGRGVIATSGQFDKNESVTVRLTPNGVQGEPDVVVLERASGTGKLRASIPVPAGKATAYDVTATWSTEDAARQAITRSVKLDAT